MADFCIRYQPEIKISVFDSMRIGSRCSAIESPAHLRLILSRTHRTASNRDNLTSNLNLGFVMLIPPP